MGLPRQRLGAALAARTLPSSATGLGTRVWALLGAFSLAAVLFMLIPLTQMQDVERDLVVYREMQLANLAPPKAPPQQEQEELKEEVDPPKMEESFQELDLQQLELSLNPGIGEALAMGAASLSLDTEMDIMEQVQQIFQFSDLESVPTMISAPRFDYPQSLIRRGIKKGTVDMLIRIDEAGKATVLEVVSSPHEDLTRVAKNLIERTRFTIPQIDGRPVVVDGNLPLTLEAP